MKKSLILFLCMTMVLSMLAGCDTTNTDSDRNSQMGASAGEGTGTDTNTDTEKNTLDNDNKDVSEAPVVSEEQLAMVMEYLGISAEEFYSYSVDKQVALLDELGIVASEREEKESEKDSIKTYTSDDVAAGGKYKVTMGDGMMWNYYEFYYEDGKLVKIYMSFRKNDEEEPDISTIEGSELQNNKFYGMTVEEIENEFKNKDYGYNTYINKIED